MNYLRHKLIVLTSCLLLMLVSSNSAFAVPGLSGSYWNLYNQKYNATTPPDLSRVDSEINFNWGNNRPDSAIGYDNFVVRWTGYILIPTDGDYKFSTTTDDGVRLWIDDQLIINDWGVFAAKTLVSSAQPLIGGRQYRVRLEYFENYGEAVAQLKWQTPSNSTSTVIPSSQLDTQRTAQLLHHYTFDSEWDTTNSVIDIVGSSNGLVNGSVERVLSPLEDNKFESCYAAKFNNGNIRLANLELELDEAEQTSVSFWMKWNGGNSEMPIGWDQYDLWFYNNKFGFNTWNLDIYGIQSNASIKLADSWHHITAVFTNGSVTDNVLYVDGKKQSLAKQAVPGYGKRDPAINNAIVANALTLSGYNQGNVQRFNGSIDNLKIYRGEISQAQVTADMNESNRCGEIKPQLEWHLDNASLHGTVNEIIDYSGNNNHGTIVDLVGSNQSSGHVSSVASGQICRAANISADNSRDNYYALDTKLVMGNRGTISFWYAPKSASNKQRTLFDGTSDGNHDKYFFLRREKNGKLTFALEDNHSNEDDFRYRSVDKVLASNAKVHISASWDLEQGLMALHVNGHRISLKKKNRDISSNTGIIGSLSSLYFGDNRNEYTIDVSNGGLHTADGAFDEIVIFEQALSDVQIKAIYDNQNLGKNWDGGQRDDCEQEVIRFTVEASDVASTCKAHNVTVSAWDANNALISNFSGTIKLATSNNNGSWSIGSSSDAAGLLTDNIVDSGAGLYQFVASDGGQVNLQLLNQHADKLSVSVDDQSGHVVNSGEIAFSDNAFVITNEDDLAGSDHVIAGRDHQYQVELWTKGQGSCTIATNYNDVNQQLKAWLVRDGDFTNGLAPKITSVSNNDSVPNAQPNSTNITLNFNAGVAQFYLQTSDVGKYALKLLDDSKVFANNVDIAGGSNSQVIRPFGLAFSEINQAGKLNSGGDETTGGSFVAAGQPFSLTLGAYLYDPSEDSDGNGLPDAGVNISDNGLTPAFSAATRVDIASFTPSLGVKGVLAGEGVATDAYAGGKVTLSGVSYSEVGSIELSASISNYLNSGINLTTNSESIGRFYPDHFMVSAVSAPVISETCVSGDFSYMGQDNLGVSYTLKAMSTTSTVTQNYDNNTLAYTQAAAINYHAHNNGATTELNVDNRLAVGAAAQWLAGQYEIAVNNANFSKLAMVDGPYSKLQLSISVDTAAELDGRDFSAGGSKDIGESLDMRFGRATLKSAFGPEYGDLALPVELQSFDGTKFVTNTADNCTALTTATLSNPLPVATSVTDVSAILAGVGTVLLSAPNPSGIGETTVELEVAPWLKFDWDGNLATAQQNPAAVATFGRYRGNDRIIFWQEIN